MSGHTDKKRSKLKATVAIIVIFAVAAAVIFLISEEQFGEINTVYDDQRSTLWPLLITLIATMYILTRKNRLHGRSEPL